MISQPGWTEFLGQIVKEREKIQLSDMQKQLIIKIQKTTYSNRRSNAGSDRYKLSLQHQLVEETPSLGSSAKHNPINYSSLHIYEITSMTSLRDLLKMKI